MYRVRSTKEFRKDYKRARKRNRDMDLLWAIVERLADGAPLDEAHCDHNLSGDWKGYRECHITPDWLLIYKTDRGILVLTLMRTGTHSDLFSK